MNELMPKFENFSINEESIVLQKADQSNILKKITKSFDEDDIRIYLKGMLIDLDKTTRKKLLLWLDSKKYKQFIDALLKDIEDPTMRAKLLNIQKSLKQEKEE
jgi:hypothetical protein